MANGRIQRKKVISAVFYRTAAGRESVREWLQDFSRADRKIIGADIADVEYGWPVGMPLCRPLGSGLYEVRSNISDERISRVIFFLNGANMVLLHGFVKKSEKTPKGDMDLALRRKREVKND